MRYRRFGRTDIDVSEVSFGAMRVTGDAAHVARSRPPTPAEVQQQNSRGRRALEAALDGGVNCIHSSDDYGTRWLLGDVLRTHPRRAEVHHVVKVTTPDYEEDAVDTGLIRRKVEQALSDLHADRISFVQHLQRGPRVSKHDAYSAVGDRRRIDALPRLAEEFLGAIDELRDEGKVGHAVTFPHTMAYAEAALQDQRWAGTVHFFNLLETEGLRLLDSVGSGDRGYFALRPLLQGLITDKRIDREQLPPEDDKLGPAWDSRYALLARIRDLVGEPAGGWTAYGIRFALGHPGVTSLITSAGDERQTTEILAALDEPPVDVDVVRAVDSLIRESGELPKSDLFVENLLHAR